MAGPESAEIHSSLLAHLRLHFQLLLAPIFLWGYFLSRVRAPADFWLAFVAFSIGVQALGAALLAIAIAQRLDPIRAALWSASMRFC